MTGHGVFWKLLLFQLLKEDPKLFYFFRHRELFFSFCVNRSFLHNSNWNSRYSCTLYSSLVRNLGCKVELHLTDSVHQPEKAIVQQDAENVIVNKKIWETTYLHISFLIPCPSLWSVIVNPQISWNLQKHKKSNKWYHPLKKLKIGCFPLSNARKRSGGLFSQVTPFVACLFWGQTCLFYRQALPEWQTPERHDQQSRIQLEVCSQWCFPGISTGSSLI